MAKKIILSVLILAALPFAAYFIEKAMRCKEDGFTREGATEISIRKLETDFSLPFSLKKELFNDKDKSWMFTYQEGDCIVDVIVDRCGASDIGGLTGECMPFQKK
jgi:hypothetical protein